MQTSSRTNWPHAQERLRPILDTLFDIAGQPAFGPSMKKTWRNGARVLADELSAAGHGEARYEEFVRWAWKTHKDSFEKQGKYPLVKSPASFVYLVQRFKPKKSAREKYKSGKFADFWEE